jgi:hypothetical protein
VSVRAADRDLYGTSASAMGDPYPDPPRSVVRRFLLALGAQADRAVGTSFSAGFTDFQTWVRNEDLAPDWLWVGTDIVGNPYADVQRHVLAGRPDRPRDPQPDYVDPGSGRCISRSPGATPGPRILR